MPPRVNVSFLGDLLSQVGERGRALVGLGPAQAMTWQDVARRAEDLISNRGEASGVALARDVLAGYATLGADGRTQALRAFATRFGPDLDALGAAARAYAEAPDAAGAMRLQDAAEPRRQELIRRLNLAPGGTPALVRMREDVMDRLAAAPDLAPLDRDFLHLFSSWFNRGFLMLRRIDWSTPANILEKIIRYEAVHAIAGWDDLRRRLEPGDRRLYAFFHPALVDEPLIFVEVALTQTIPSAIAPLLAPPPQDAATASPKVAVFYSISNAQRGLAGVSFGNFLIKQVVEELRREAPSLQTFVTLSPAPGFARWLKGERQTPASPLLTPDDRRALDLLDHAGWPSKAAATTALERALPSVAARYFLQAKTPGGRPVDPVARFHLGNGARLERVNFLGDGSPKGMRESHGMMVNYLYDLDDIEANHEAFAKSGEVAASGAVRKLARPPLLSGGLLPTFP